MAFDSCKAPSSGRCKLCSVPWLPVLLGLVAIICTGIWHHFSSLALLDTKIIAKLISLPPPVAFARVLPALLAASVALVVIITLAACGTHIWRALQQRSSSMSSSSSAVKAPRGLLIAAGLANTLLFVLLIWLVVMFAISLLWLGGGMIASKATMDGANTLTVVDETLPKLIKAAMGIDPAKAGYLVTVAGRDVDIGKSSCSLFCFTLARAMLADTIDCTCDSAFAQQLLPAAGSTHDITSAEVCRSTPVMCSVNAYAFQLYEEHMKPAVVCIMLALLSVVGLLMLMSGMYARLLSEQRCGSSAGAISRTSSTDAQMRVDGSSAGDSPRKIVV
ncbi:hypothetical protein OEZ86_012622 [Tetradesmus obliquus]|nr:hypothetical protein OEZ86_012622 [Tetradesmus obliquus]